MIDKTSIYSVTEINKQVNKTLLRNYNSIWIKGEVSNYKKYPSGHSYFTIKDNNSEISCVFFYSYSNYENIKINDGVHVVLYGNIKIFEKRGQYQFQVISLEKSGQGFRGVLPG